ncbi:MAG: hypothetical protein HQK67_11855, partial [Desulfamplus sp.]|nr:hypothetical protein [Desulfamplus sp.]
LKYLIFVAALLTGLNLISINTCGILALPFGEASAQDLSGLKLSGFGTLSTTLDDRDDICPVRDIGQTPNPNRRYKNNWTAVMDSRLGLQAHYRANSDLDFVIQGVLRDQAYVNLKNSVELAYFSFRPSSWLEFRGGKLGYDAFLMSNTRNFGYAYSWVRPPIDFYGWIPVFHMDGADATLRVDRENSQWQFRVQVGEQNMPFTIDRSDYESQTRGLYTLTLGRQSGPFTLKAGYSSFSLTNEMSMFVPLQEGLEPIVNNTDLPSEIIDEARYFRNNLTFKDVEITYMTLGASYDDGQWIAQAEIARSTSTAEVFTHGSMGYASLGYRIGDFTPYFILSAIRAANDVRKPVADWSFMEESWMQDVATSIINTTRMNQDTRAMGIRWDFHLQAALKFQLDNIHIHPNGYGMWFSKGNTSDRESRINLGTVSMEIMF